MVFFTNHLKYIVELCPVSKSGYYNVQFIVLEIFIIIIIIIILEIQFV